jgi:chaperonin cofactor prefoldin
VPELREVVGELKQLNKRLASVEISISELRADVREDGREVLQKIDDSHEKTREVLIEEIRKSAKLEVRIDLESLRNEMVSRFEAVDARFEAIYSRFDSLEAKLPVMEKMAEFEVRLAEFEKKVTA